MLERQFGKIPTAAWQVFGVAFASVSLASAVARPDLRYLILVMTILGAATGLLVTTTRLESYARLHGPIWLPMLLLALVRGRDLWAALSVLGAIGVSVATRFGVGGALAPRLPHWLWRPVSLLAMGLAVSVLHADTPVRATSGARDLLALIADTMTVVLLVQAVVLFFIGVKLARQRADEPASPADDRQQSDV